MPGNNAAGSKPKAQGNASRSPAAASSDSPEYLIQCTRDSGIDEYDEDLFIDCHGDEQKGAECMVDEEVKQHDGTWLYNTPAPGSKKHKTSRSSSSSRGIAVFRTLEAANTQAARVWEKLQANPPFDSEADDIEGEQGGDPAAEQGPESFQTMSADGRAKWQRQQWYYYDPHNPGELQNVVASTLTVEVVSASWAQSAAHEVWQEVTLVWRLRLVLLKLWFFLVP